MKRVCTFFILVLFCALTINAQKESSLRLPQLFQSGMVMQRGVSLPVWGWAKAGESVDVVFKKKVYTSVADANGRWQVELPAQKAGGPYTIIIKCGEQQTELTNVLIGDVWLCSGQSNIDVTIERVYPQYGKVIDDYSNEQIRMFRVQTDTDMYAPKEDVKTTPINWLTASKQNAWLFSAVGYFLAREMYEKTGVPQGVIVNSLGGTPIQAWLSADSLQKYFPNDYRRLQFYQDDEMVAAMSKSNQKVSSRWDKLLDTYDPGLSEGYAEPGYDDHEWVVKNQYDQLTTNPQYTGSFWARQQVKVDASHAGQPARLLVGTLYDMDYTFLNGKEVGRTYYQYPPRRYQIPSGLLREGDNTLAIRFVTKGGAPHFIKEKPYKIIFEDGVELPLSEQWRIHEGAKMQRPPLADLGVQNLPSVLYNAMLHPLAPYSLAGVVWYQGESNTGDGKVYEQMLTQLITGWRQLWKNESLPFVVVQLANFMEPSDKPQYSGWSEIREAQRLATLHNSNTELAVIIDMGETVDIHPLRKREVAQRVALGFERMLWNKKLTLSPVVTKSIREGNQVTLSLDQPLRSDGVLYEFELAGADGRFVNAEAIGNGSTIVVTSPIENPVYVRYAWKNNPIRCNVFAKNGLPMSPFTMKVN
jgi:sialate O-acetylesterase